MTPRQTIAAFALSDKIKSGLIWASAAGDQAAAYPEPGRQGAVAVARTLLELVLNEAVCARQATGDPAWDEAIRAIEKARVMLCSGVPAEVSFHLTRALGQVTRIGRQAGESLQTAGLL